MSSSFYETLMSVCRHLNYNDNIEVILADAVDGTAYELCRKYGEDDNTLLLDKVRFVDISSQIFENMAQIKNESVKYATNRRVLILTDSQILQEGIIEKCLLTDRIEVSDDELKSYYNAGTDAFSYLVADRDTFSSIGDGIPVSHAMRIMNYLYEHAIIIALINFIQYILMNINILFLKKHFWYMPIFLENMLQNFAIRVCLMMFCQTGLYRQKTMV